MKTTTLIAGLILTLLTSSALLVHAQYIAYDLGAPHFARSINNAQTVAGWKGDAARSTGQAFSYNGGVITELGTLGGRSSYAYGINDAGTIVGFSETSNGVVHAFSYSDGHMTDIGTLGGATSYAYAINTAGTIVGSSATSNGVAHAFSYSNGKMTDLGTLGGGNSTAYAINNAGTIVGDSDIIGAGFPHAFSYSGGVMTDLGTLLGSSSGFGINDSGTIVGSDYSGGRAFSYTGGIVTYLGSLGGRSSGAGGINRAGTIVGSSETPDGLQHPVIYSAGQIMDLLPNLVSLPYMTIVGAAAINDNGDIVGWGYSVDGPRAFLLTPLPTLLIRPSGTDLVIAWLTNAPAGLSLFENTNLATTNWTAVTNTPTVTNNQQQVVISGPLAGSRYYRLQSQ